MPFLAHLATGAAAKAVTPEANVIGLVVAAEALDLVHLPPISLVVDVPLWATHGLTMAAVWSAVVMLALRLLHRTLRVCLIYGAAVFSHWLLDFIAHPMGAVLADGSPQPADLPLVFADSPLVGLGLYNHSAPLAYAFEFGVTLLGVGVYAWFRRRARAATDPATGPAPTASERTLA